MAKAPKEVLLEQERFELKPKSGGGLLNYEIWGYVVKGRTVVTRYNLAYINHAIPYVLPCTMPTKIWLFIVT